MQSLGTAFGRLFAQGECKTTTLSLYAAHGGSKMKPPIFFDYVAPHFDTATRNKIEFVLTCVLAFNLGVL